MKKTTSIYHKIAQNILQLRTAQHLSQEMLATKAQLNRTYIGAIERGEKHPSVETLEKIAHALGVRVYELLQFDDE